MKKVVFLFTALIVSVVASAQVDFSGTWKLDKSKSKLGDQFSFAPGEIIIVQTGNEMSVERHVSFQDQQFTTNDKFTLDGKECINPGFMDTQKKSTATWSEDQASLKIVSKIAMQDGEMTITEVYKMDGGNMVIESLASSSYGDMAETQVYVK